MAEGSGSPDIARLSEVPKERPNSDSARKPWLPGIQEQREQNGEPPLRERGSRPDPTEASRGFLRKFTDKLFTDRSGNAQFFVQALMTGGVARLAIQDAIQGNYPSAVAEGIVAGALVVSPIRMFNRIRKPIE